MEADLYQQNCLRTAGKHDMYTYASFGLGGEAGEVLEFHKKWLFHGHPYEEEKILKELGDVAWYLAVLSHAHNFKLSEVFQANLDKLAERYPEGFSSEKSINRAD